MTRVIIQQVDDILLTYNTEDGQRVEPSFYAPIVPLALINGKTAIGIGFKTVMLPLNPLETIDNLISLIEENEVNKMLPFFVGFSGEVNARPILKSYAVFLFSDA